MLFILTACADTPDDPAPPEQPQPTEAPAPPPPPPPPPPGPSETYEIDFSDGNIGFLMLNTTAFGADSNAQMQVDTLDGASALKLQTPGGGNLHLGINADGLLGDRVTDVRTVVMEVYAEYPSGNFSAVSGKISAFSNDTAEFASDIWTVYLASRNPNLAIFEFASDVGFDAAGPNMFEFSCLDNGPAKRGESPAIIWIKSIIFYDASNIAIAVNTDAGWAGPDGYGDAAPMMQFDLPYPPPHGDSGGWQEWRTPGTDDEPEDYLPWEVLAASVGIVFEMEQPDSFEMLYFGAFNGWNWTQTQVANMWEDGELTIMWSAIGFNPRTVTEEDNAAKIGFGNWNQFTITRAYLLVDGAALPSTEHRLPNPPPHGSAGSWQEWRTPGTDDEPGEYMPWEILAASDAIVFVMDQPDSFEFVFFGAFNGWSWTQVQVADMWEDGKLTIRWLEIGFDPQLVNAEDNAAKLAFGNWNGFPITEIYLELNPSRLP